MDYSLKNTQKLFVDFIYKNEGFEKLKANIISPSPYEVLQIYRKHVWKSLLSTLESHYKIIYDFLGQDKFYELANLYILEHPSEVPDLELYGWKFPQFLLEQAQDFKLIHDIALLCLAGVRAGIGDQYTCASIEKFVSIKPEDYENIVFYINPTCVINSFSYDICYQFLNAKNFSICEQRKNVIAVVRSTNNLLSYVKLSETESKFIDLCIQKKRLLDIFTVMDNDDLDMQAIIPKLVTNQIIHEIKIKS
jgi:hypothetical protein